MPLDTNIALQAQAPQFNPLQMAMQAAQLKAYNTHAQSQQQQLDSNNALSAAIASATKNGVTDWDAAMGNAASNPAAAFNLPQFAKSVQEMRQAKQTYDRGEIGLNNDQRDNYANGLKFFTQQFATVDPKDPNAAGKIMQIGADAVTNGHIAPAVYKAMVNQMPDDPKQWPQFLQQKLASFQDAGAQLSSITPKPVVQDLGGKYQVNDSNVITNPGYIGTTMNKSLTPEGYNAPVNVLGPDGKTPGIKPAGEVFGAGTPNINIPPLPTGANPQGAGQAAPLPGQPAPAQASGGHFVATGPAMGVADSNAGNVDVVNKHWATVGNDANNAQTNIGIAQNIKAYARQAATGKQGDKLAAANGLLSVFGVGGQTDLSTATDLLQKNMARLSLTSRQGAGGTDAAGALATAANPHGSMTMAAIEDAADQVIGAQKMAIAQQQLLQPYKLSNDVAGYQTALSKFNQAADPRVWQFQGMDAQQRAKFKASMSPADQKAFGNKIRTLEGIGAIQ
jgi:hypothetical protein